MSALLCPQCGNTLKWSCAGDEGEAVCSALQSRVLNAHDRADGPLCHFVGEVRRISPSEVVLVASAVGRQRGGS